MLYSHQTIDTRTEGLGNKMSRYYPNNYVIEIGHITEKSPGDLRILIVTQTPVKYHQLMLMWKTLKE